MQAGSLQKKCLTAGEPERPCFVTRGVKEAIWQVHLRAPFSSARLAPRPDGPLTHFTSPRGEKCRLELVSAAGSLTTMLGEEMRPASVQASDDCLRYCCDYLKSFSEWKVLLDKAQSIRKALTLTQAGR